MLLCTLQLTSETLRSQPDQLRQGNFASLMSTGQTPGTFLPVLSRSHILFHRIAFFRALARTLPALQLDNESRAISRSFQSLFDNLLPLSNQQVGVLPLFYLTGCACVFRHRRICFVTRYRCTNKHEQLLNISEG